MTKAEILTFIEEMEAIGDKWTPEQVESVYGNYTLERALSERKASVGMYLDILGKTMI